MASQAAQSVLRRLDCNFKSFFSSVKKGTHAKIPKYKDKNGYFIWEYAGSKISIRNNAITIPKTKYKIRTKLKDEKILWLRIVPQNDKISVEICYEKNTETNYELKHGKTVGIDIGINNLMAMSSNENDRSCLVNGRPLKSMSHYYNSKLAKMKKVCKITSGKNTSRLIKALHRKRNNKVGDYMHKASRLLINYCIENRVSRIVIGCNKEWKKKCNLGKRHNQSFCQIPTGKLISMIEYKAHDAGILVEITEESYTSKTDHLLFEEMKHLDTRLGKRIKRGMFKSGSGILLNADINGAYGMLRKKNAVDERFFKSIVDTGHVVWPLKLNVSR